MCCKTRLGKKRLRGEGHDGGVGWAVCCECLSVGFEAVSQPKETTGEYHMHSPSRMGAVGLRVMGGGLSPILSSGTVQPVCQLPEVVMEMKLEGTG